MEQTRSVCGVRVTDRLWSARRWSARRSSRKGMTPFEAGSIGTACKKGVREKGSAFFGKVLPRQTRRT